MNFKKTAIIAAVAATAVAISSAAFAAPPTARALKERNRQLFPFLRVI